MNKCYYSLLHSFTKSFNELTYRSSTIRQQWFADEPSTGCKPEDLLPLGPQESHVLKIMPVTQTKSGSSFQGGMPRLLLGSMRWGWRRHNDQVSFICQSSQTPGSSHSAKNSTTSHRHWQPAALPPNSDTLIIVTIIWCYFSNHIPTSQAGTSRHKVIPSKHGTGPHCLTATHWPA